MRFPNLGPTAIIFFGEPAVEIGRFYQHGWVGKFLNGRLLFGIYRGVEPKIGVPQPPKMDGENNGNTL